MRWGQQTDSVPDPANAEEELRRQTDFSAALLKAQSDLGEGFIILDGQRIVHTNEACTQISGYSAAELLALPSIFALVVSEQRGLLSERLRRRLSGQSVEDHYETAILHKSGQRVDLEVAVKPFQVEGRTQLIIIVRDITARKRGEEERAQLLLREQAARAEAEAAQRRAAFLAEASTLLAASLDYPTTLASVARLAVPDLADWCAVDVVEADGSIRRLGVAHVDAAKEELLRELQRRYPPDSQGPRPVARVLRSGQPAFIPEVPDSLREAFARDAEHLQMLRQLGLKSYMCVPLLARGRTLGALTFASAESGRRYGPADLALAEDLAGRAALAVDNARLYGEAQVALRLRDEFVTTASHDLKNPLTSIKGLAQILRERAARASTADSERLVQGLARIDAVATRMAALIDELLDLAYLRLNRPLALDRRPTDLVGLVRQAAAEQEQVSQRHRLRVEAAVPHLVGVWDAARLERVIANLLGNAIKYSPEGGEVSLVVAREEDAAGAWAVLTVQDHGLGIPAADLPHVFERFHRAGNVVGRIKGTGIGLAGARQIVEQHGGTIAVASQEGAGSTFTVRLPLAPRDARGDGATA